MTPGAAKMSKGIKDMHERVICNQYNVSNTETDSTSRTTLKSLGVNDKFSLSSLRRDLKIRVTSYTKEKMEFELIGVEAPIANALRRILIAEVPTVAIEKVGYHQNTSIVQDEVFAHRLGLVPLKTRRDEDIDALFKFPANAHANPPKPMKEGQSNTVDEEEETEEQVDTEEKEDVEMDNEEPSDASSGKVEEVSLSLSLRCKWRDESLPEDSPDVERYENAHVLSESIVPKSFDEEGKPLATPVHSDILLAKLRPGQQIRCQMKAVKGIGRDHAKFSPVCTASYRLLPDIRIGERERDGEREREEIVGREAEELVERCPMGVFDIEDGVAIVKNPKMCTMCRECTRDTPYADKISLGRRRRHYLFTVESSGAYSDPANIVRTALRVLAEAKAQQQINQVNQMIEEEEKYMEE